MKFDELPTDELVHIFKYCDHESKKNLMLVCKKFENVMGNYLQLFGNFVLDINCNCGNMIYEQDHEPKLMSLPFTRRHFGTVKIRNLNSAEMGEHFEKILLLFKRIGKRVFQLVLASSVMDDLSFIRLVCGVSNVSSLKMQAVQLTHKRAFADENMLGKLTHLELFNVRNVKILEKLIKPNSLYCLKLQFASTVNEWKTFQSILVKQKKLTVLEFENLMIKNFNDCPGGWDLKNVQKLKLTALQFNDIASFQNFTKFIKTFDKISNLTFNINWNLDCSEMLGHLLSLPTLTDLSLAVHKVELLGLFQKIRIRNKAVQSIVLKGLPINTSYSEFVKAFPNVCSANLGFRFGLMNILNSGHIDMSLINDWTNLKELRVFCKNDYALREIQLQHLKKFIFRGGISHNPKAWTDFGENNPQVEHLEVSYVIDLGFLEHLKKILVWPNLKCLLLDVDFETAAQEIRATKLIENYGKNLEYLKMNITTTKGKRAFNSVKKRLPKLKEEVKVYDDGSEF